MARLGTATLVALLAACLLHCAAATLSSASCDGTLGQCAVGREAEEEEVGGDAFMRRAMAQRQPTNRYISYAALRADQVPCNQRGRSYYSNCASQQPANPYRRGCSVITKCARNTN